MHQFRLELLHPPLGLAPLGHVADEAGEDPLPGDGGLAHGELDRKTLAVPAQPRLGLNTTDEV